MMKYFSGTWRSHRNQINIAPMIKMLESFIPDKIHWSRVRLSLVQYKLDVKWRDQIAYNTCLHEACAVDSPQLTLKLRRNGIGGAVPSTRWWCALRWFDCTTNCTRRHLPMWRNFLFSCILSKSPTDIKHFFAPFSIVHQPSFNQDMPRSNRFSRAIAR